jgi:hypothetical protein
MCSNEPDGGVLVYGNLQGVNGLLEGSTDIIRKGSDVYPRRVAAAVWGVTV